MSTDIWFISDTHWNHANIIKYCKRPFASIGEMNEKLIENWNARVKPGDSVYHLGDFALKVSQQEVENLVRRLNGQIHLIWGNHDQKNKSVLKATNFAEKVPYKELKIGDLKIVMCHYPFLTWNRAHHGSWDLHGHSHGNLPRDPNARRVDVGVDCWNYSPVSFDEIRVEMEKVQFKPVDHHREERDL